MAKFKQNNINYTINVNKDVPITLSEGIIASIEYNDDLGNKITSENNKPLSSTSGNAKILNAININWNLAELNDVKTGFLPISNSKESISTTGDLLRLINFQYSQLTKLDIAISKVYNKVFQNNGIAVDEESASILGFETNEALMFEGTEVEDPVPTSKYSKVTNQNMIEIDTSELPAGQYTLKYIDAYNQPIDNFESIATITTDGDKYKEIFDNKPIDENELYVVKPQVNVMTKTDNYMNEIQNLPRNYEVYDSNRNKLK